MRSRTSYLRMPSQAQGLASTEGAESCIALFRFYLFRTVSCVVAAWYVLCPPPQIRIRIVLTSGTILSRDPWVQVFFLPLHGSYHGFCPSMMRVLLLCIEKHMGATGMNPASCWARCRGSFL